jgi:LacI family transcriptional regulator, galactose operon repressor
VLNDAPVASRVAAETRAKILSAARQFHYRPNITARCLRPAQFPHRSHGSEVSEGYNSMLLSGISTVLSADWPRDDS